MLIGAVLTYSAFTSGGGVAVEAPKLTQMFKLSALRLRRLLKTQAYEQNGRSVA